MSCMDILSRELAIKLPINKSAFLWGPRKVGKSHWLRTHFADDILIDFLKTDVLADYASSPALLRQRFAETKQRIVIDEVQMVPTILNEVHWLIENRDISFILTGSSSRKLKRNHANLLGGRAWRYHMTPLCFPEVSHIDLEKMMITGMLPPHVLSEDPRQDLRAYVADYLKEEIIAEATVQNIPAFSNFLRTAALTCGELINYTNVARDSGVSAKVVRNYFQILEDTLLGFRLQAWKKTIDRRLIETEKFYLFDVGLANYLLQRQPTPGTPEFGKSFEHFILLELVAYKAYKNPELLLHYWRTSTGLEVDFILGDMDVAIEVKSSSKIDERDTKNLQTLREAHRPRRCLLVSTETQVKTIKHIECLPWQTFLEQLWADLL